MEAELASEIRSWPTLAFAALGGFLALRSYFAGQRQRRLENSFRMVQLFHDSLRPKDLEVWEAIFHASSDSAGASPGHFVALKSPDQVEHSFGDLFSEGPYDNGAIERMAEAFDLIGYEAMRDTVDLRSIYFQLGQLMDTVYDWLEISIISGEGGSLVASLHPHFHRLYAEQKLNREWPRRTYAHIG